MSVGNIEEARLIHAWWHEGLSAGVSHYNMILPEGWRRLGAGCYRTAYRSPSGVAYKVDRWADGSWQSNAKEAQTIRGLMLTRLPKGCRLPRFQLFSVDGGYVMAMEAFTRLLDSYSQWGDGRQYWELRHELRRALGLTDMHGANLAVDDEGLLVPIDLGEN